MDARYGLRALSRAPGFTAVSVLVLAVGIAASTTIFSGVHAVLLAPLPFNDTDRLVGLWERNPDFGWEQADAAPANVLDWRDRVEAFADVAAYRGNSVGQATWIHEGDPRALGIVEVTGNLFSVLGVRPVLGTLPTFEDTWADGEHWVVVSHAFWRAELGSDSAAVGRTLDLDGTTVRIRAVLPPDFRFPSEVVDLWAPYRWAPSDRTEAWFRRAHFVTPIARLTPGTTVEQARAELDAVALQLQGENPTLNANMFAGMTPLREWLVGDLGNPLRTLMGGVLLLLVIACVNVGNLSLVRAAGRGGELSLRRAVGASGGRIVRQLLAESLLVGAAGGALGVALSAGGIELLRHIRPLGVAGSTSLTLNVPVLVFAVVSSLFCALALGVAPALKAASSATPGRLTSGPGAAHTGPRTGGALGQLLVPIQIGLAVVLVLGASLVTLSFARLQAEDPGIEPEGVWTFLLSIPPARYSNRDVTLAFWDGVVERVEAIPGVHAAAVTSGVPLWRFPGWTSQLVARDWAPGRVAYEVRHRASTPAYFEVMGVPLLAGRPFGPRDGLDGERVVVVNQTFANAYFAGESVLGRQVTFDREPTESSVWRTIVGVVGDERQRALSLPPDAEVWEPLPQDWGQTRRVAFKYDGDSAGLQDALTAAVRDVDADVPVTDLLNMETVLADASADARFLLLLFGLFASIALVLAAVGVYGVTAETVRRRIPEFGIRLALGARGAEVERLVVRRVLVMAGLGVASGLAAGLVLAGVFESLLVNALLYETPIRDRVAFTLAPALLLTVSILAGWSPARRAARVDPVRSLKSN
jgi:putative ABC transport system permease protein